MRAEFVVLGAGVAGLAAAKSLRDAGHDVLVVDRASVCGGAHRSRLINGHTFDVGSIFFEATHPLFSLFPGLEPECPPVRRRQQRITPSGGLAHYPFEPREILGWPLRDRISAAGELLWGAARRAPAPETVEDLCRARLGETIYARSGLRSYITRFHQEPPSAIGADFFEKRMGFVAKNTGAAQILAQVLRVLRNQPARSAPPAPLRVRPAAGFGRFYEIVARQLRAEGVRFILGNGVARIGRTGDVFEVVLADARRLVATRVVSAIPLPEVYRMTFGEPLPIDNLDLLTLFVSCPKGSPVEGNVLFNFHGSGRWKRLTRYSEIYAGQRDAGLRLDREFFSVEITLPRSRPPDPEAAFGDFVNHAGALGLFSAELVLEGWEVVKDAYPVYRPATARQVGEALDRLTRHGVVSVGRQGRFDYLPVSSAVIHATRKELANHDLIRSGAD